MIPVFEAIYGLKGLSANGEVGTTEVGSPQEVIQPEEVCEEKLSRPFAQALSLPKSDSPVYGNLVGLLLKRASDQFQPVRRDNRVRVGRSDDLSLCFLKSSLAGEAHPFSFLSYDVATKTPRDLDGAVG